MIETAKKIKLQMSLMHHFRSLSLFIYLRCCFGVTALYAKTFDDDGKWYTSLLFLHDGFHLWVSILSWSLSLRERESWSLPFPLNPLKCLCCLIATLMASIRKKVKSPSRALFLFALSWESRSLKYTWVSQTSQGKGENIMIINIISRSIVVKSSPTSSSSFLGIWSIFQQPLHFSLGFSSSSRKIKNWWK